MNRDIPASGFADVWYCKGARTSSFKSPTGRAHRLVEVVLSRYLGSDAGKLRVVKDALGRPAIERAPPSLGFSVSYAKDDLIVAVAKGPVGADIEDEDDHVRFDEVARRWLHPGEARRIEMAAPRDRPHAFFRAWTLRESYLKAIGTGFRTAASSAEIVPAEPDAPRAGVMYLGHALIAGHRHLALASRFPLRCFRIFHVDRPACSSRSRHELLLPDEGHMCSAPALFPNGWRAR